MRGHPRNEALRQLGVQARRFLVVVVEEENDVEVRDITEFLAAQLAIRDDGEFRHVAVARRDGLPDGLHGGGDDDVGQLRQVVGQLFHAEVARQVLRQALEQLCVVHFAQDIHLPLRVAGRIVELALQVERQGGRVGHRVADALV
ncbi:hypothetical protein D3C81_1582100 [compost metagenome]